MVHSTTTLFENGIFSLPIKFSKMIHLIKSREVTSRLFIKYSVLINLITIPKIPFSKNVVVHSTTTMSYEIQ